MNVDRGALPHVELRAPRLEDADEFLEMVAASRSLHHPWAYPPADRRAFELYVEKAFAHRNARFLACVPDGGPIVGVVSLSQIIRGVLQSAFIGFYANASCSGRGYMTAAVCGALDHAFGELELHRVEANVQPGNTRSLALVKRCGFRREGFSPRYLRIGGVWCDHERWAVLADEWPMGETGTAGP